MGRLFSSAVINLCVLPLNDFYHAIHGDIFGTFEPCVVGNVMSSFTISSYFLLQLVFMVSSQFGKLMTSVFF